MGFHQTIHQFPETRASSLNFHLIFIFSRTFFSRPYSLSYTQLSRALFFSHNLLSASQESHVWVASISYLSRSAIFLLLHRHPHSQHNSPIKSDNTWETAMYFFPLLLSFDHFKHAYHVSWQLSHPRPLVSPPCRSAPTHTSSFPVPLPDSWLWVLFCG